MKILVFRNADEGSEYAANMVLNKLRTKPNLVIGLATGSSPLKLYSFLVLDHEQNGTSWANVTTFNLDEYKGLKPNDEDSYHYFMQTNLFSKLGINESQTYFPNAKENYDELIASKGGIDLQILGVGTNGHIAFNEPGSNEFSKSRLVELSKETISVNANKFFNGDLKAVPKEAYTMGIKTILQAKEIILLAFGSDKSNAIRTLLKANDYMPEFPVTALIRHPNVTVIVDPEVDLGM